MGVSSKKINRRKQLEDGAYGASCRKNNECRDGSFCGRDLRTNQVFCQKLFVEGDTCQNHDNNQCEGTLLCSRYTRQCSEQLGVGEDCAGKRDLCSAGLFCKDLGNNGRTCKAQLDEGETCQNHDNNQCEGTLLCSRDTRQCTKPLKVGEDCAESPDLCSAGLFCSIENYLCRKRVGSS